MTCYWRDMLPDTPADKAYALRSYGHVLQGNKALLTAATRSGGAVTDAMLALMMAMAMLETTTMSADDRDRTKDGSPDRSANCSMFNLSEDLLLHIGYTGRFEDLNDVHNLPTVVAQIGIGVKKLGVHGFLNFVRGGRKGFLDGTSYGVDAYRATIATILSVIDAHPRLLSNDQRVDINLVHV